MKRLLTVLLVLCVSSFAFAKLKDGIGALTSLKCVLLGHEV